MIDKGKNKYYFRIAGFNLLIVFYRNERFASKEKLRFEVVEFLRSFMVKAKLSPIDYQIDVVWDRYSEIKFYLEKKYSERHFINFFETKSKNKTLTFYRNSLLEFNILLRFVLTYLLIHNHGFFIHASAAERNGKADIFLGESGAGKSTARNLLSPDYRSLADDVVIIKKESGTYYAYQMPFFEGKTELGKTNKKYLLNRVFFLHKDRDFKIIPLADKNGLVKLIAKQMQFDSNQLLFKQEMKTVFSFVSEYRHFYQLHFAKDKKKLLELLC